MGVVVMSNKKCEYCNEKAEICQACALDYFNEDKNKAIAQAKLDLLKDDYVYSEKFTNYCQNTKMSKGYVEFAIRIRKLFLEELKGWEDD